MTLWDLLDKHAHGLGLLGTGVVVGAFFLTFIWMIGKAGD